MHGGLRAVHPEHNGRVRHRPVGLHPLDIARENISMVGGDMISGQTLLDQAGIFRPFHGYPPYRTPVDGLYLCGPSTHPRGGCHGACGYNAAGAVAEDIGMKPWWAGREYQILKN